MSCALPRLLLDQGQPDWKSLNFPNLDFITGSAQSLVIVVLAEGFTPQNKHHTQAGVAQNTAVQLAGTPQSFARLLESPHPTTPCRLSHTTYEAILEEASLGRLYQEAIGFAVGRLSYETDTSRRRFVQTHRCLSHLMI